MFKKILLGTTLALAAMLAVTASFAMDYYAERNLYKHELNKAGEVIASQKAEQKAWVDVRLDLQQEQQQRLVAYNKLQADYNALSEQSQKYMFTTMPGDVADILQQSDQQHLRTYLATTGRSINADYSRAAYRGLVTRAVYTQRDKLNDAVSVCNGRLNKIREKLYPKDMAKPA